MNGFIFRLYLIKFFVFRFQIFGRKWFRAYCSELGVTLQKHTRLYFERYHCEKMEELKMFLESEVFTPCPVKRQFTLFDLAVSFSYLSIFK